ncbi:response regulator [Paenibacillus eucommiae]|uniref:Two-component system response regulator YesN n=1 Tax=Paenibacillus eucommiae TaxID=1355755 RepID=A0ABS4ISH9_9BACL|nr:response regulator [Paenibacillus eucommiae]MBP1990500.1 two-component system response regulator YesN [Paenibacillus eucommiae]
MLNVLVVDDDHLVRTGFITIMPWSRHGLRVVGDVNNGEKALAFLRDNPVDLLITDLSMPVMSGIELMRQARRLLPRLRMVVLTFHHEFEYAQEAIRLGALDYITKVELEEDRMDEVLQRIVLRIAEDEQTSGAGSGPAADDFYEDPAALAASPWKGPVETGKKELQTLKEKWCSFDWMVDDERFALLLGEMLERRLTPERVEMLFEAAVSQWERILPELQPYMEMEGLHTWQQWTEWLKRLRLMVSESTQTLPYSSEVVNCIMKAQAHIRDHLEEELQMPQIARMVGMSRSYFSRCFHDISGFTFNDYIRDLRIGRAKALLVQTDKSVGWIAAQSGYPNVKYFSKVFRGATGLLPSLYRKEAKGQK